MLHLSYKRLKLTGSVDATVGIGEPCGVADSVVRVVLGVVIAGADGALEFLDSLAEGATGFGEAFGSEDEERDDQHNDQVGGLKDVGKHGPVLC
jgi:hypothetical protein